MIEEELIRIINKLSNKITELETRDNVLTFIPLSAPLTSTSWDGDAYSTTAKTLIDLSAVFGAPAGIKAILAKMYALDSASAGTEVWWGISPNDTAGSIAIMNYLYGLTNVIAHACHGICPCNVDGDIYYQVVASGASSMNIWFQIWGYWI